METLTPSQPQHSLILIDSCVLCVMEHFSSVHSRCSPWLNHPRNEDLKQHSLSFGAIVTPCHVEKCIQMQSWKWKLWFIYIENIFAPLPWPLVEWILLCTASWLCSGTGHGISRAEEQILLYLVFFSPGRLMSFFCSSAPCSILWRWR